MNFSKVFLFLFTLIALVTQILILKEVKDASSIVFYGFAVSTVLMFLMNTYVTYQINFDVVEAGK
jgi:hypothetical protein